MLGAGARAMVTPAASFLPVLGEGEEQRRTEVKRNSDSELSIFNSFGGMGLFLEPLIGEDG